MSNNDLHKITALQEENAALYKQYKVCRYRQNAMIAALLIFTSILCLLAVIKMTF